MYVTAKTCGHSSLFTLISLINLSSDCIQEFLDNFICNCHLKTALHRHQNTLTAIINKI